MDRIRIVGGNRLNGVIPISGAKNAALPLMIASLLTDDTLTLQNVPHLADVEQLIRILGNHGVDYSVNGRREKQNEGYERTINFSARNIVDTVAPYELVSKMRASFWVIGPLLARMGEAKVSLPGGCAIGTRPVDLFLEGLAALGAQIDVESGYVLTKAKLPSRRSRRAPNTASRPASSSFIRLTASARSSPSRSRKSRATSWNCSSSTSRRTRCA